MTIESTVETKTVTLMDGTAEVLSLLESAMKPFEANKLLIEIIHTEQVKTSASTVKNTVLGFAQNLSGSKLGLEKRTLPGFSVQLDKISYDLMNAYLTYSINLVVKADKTPNDAVSPTINSRCILIRELLKRLILKALNAETSPKGKIWIEIIKSFTLKLQSENQGKLLGEQRFQDFRNSLFITHKKWVDSIEIIVTLTQQYRAPESAISSVNNHIKETKATIKRQLIARLCLLQDASLKKGEFDEDYLERTLQKCETVHLESYRKKQGTNQEALMKNAKDFVIQNAIANNRLQANLILNLYVLLEDIEKLEKLCTAVNNLITKTGWTCILTGKIKVDVFIQQIVTHFKKPIYKILSLTAHDPILKAKHNLSLITYKALDMLPFEENTSWKILQDEEIKKAILASLHEDLDSLNTLCKEAGFKEDIIASASNASSSSVNSKERNEYAGLHSVSMPAASASASAGSAAVIFSPANMTSAVSSLVPRADEEPKQPYAIQFSRHFVNGFMQGCKEGIAYGTACGVLLMLLTGRKGK